MPKVKSKHAAKGVLRVNRTRFGPQNMFVAGGNNFQRSSDEYRSGRRRKLPFGR